MLQLEGAGASGRGGAELSRERTTTSYGGLANEHVNAATRDAKGRHLLRSGQYSPHQKCQLHARGGREGRPHLLAKKLSVWRCGLIVASTT